MNTKRAIVRWLLLGGSLLSVMSHATTPPSKELVAAKAAAAAATAKVDGNARAYHELENRKSLIEGTLIRNLDQQIAALEGFKSESDTIIQANDGRVKWEMIKNTKKMAEMAAAVYTGGVSKVVLDAAIDKAGDLVTTKVFGEDPLGLKVQGISGITVDVFTKQGALDGKIAQLKALVAETSYSAKPDPVTGFMDNFALTSSETVAVLKHNEAVRQLANEILDEAREMRKQQADLAASYGPMIDEMRGKQLAFFNEQYAANEAVSALEPVEKAKVEEQIATVIQALEPPKPPPPPLPEPPIRAPEETPLQVYLKYYEAGISELNYYLPDWISAAKSKDAEVKGLFAQLNQELEVNGIGHGLGGGSFGLGYLEKVLNPPEPDSANLEPGDGADRKPASLSTLAERHHFFLPAATFYSESRVASASNAANVLLQQAKNGIVTLRGIQRKIESLGPYAEGMDYFYTVLNLGASPPADLSVLYAYNQWPGIGAAFSGSTFNDITFVQGYLDYDVVRAPDLIRKLKGSVTVMEKAFADKFAAMVADLNELKPVLAAYRSAFVRTEKALADYDALTRTSRIGRDRPTELVVDYLNLDQVSRQDLTRTLDLRVLDLYGSTNAQIRTALAAVRADILRGEAIAIDYLAARQDLLAAWAAAARLYPQFKSFDGATRFEWTQAWQRQQQTGQDYFTLKVTAPDFTEIDATPWSWVFNYVTPNPMLTAFEKLDRLPVPTFEEIEDLLNVLTATEQLMQNSDAWSHLPAAQISANLQQWQQTQAAWLRTRSADWTAKFGAWACQQMGFTRDFVLSSHAFVNGDPAAPVITRQPVPTKVTRGGSAELSIGVQGSLYSCDWYIYLPYAGSSFLLQSCPNSFGLSFQTPPVSADTLFVCKLRWGRSPDASGKVLYSDVISVSVDDNVNQSVSPASLVVPGTGGTYGVQLTSTGTAGSLAWTTSPSASWVSTTAAGTGAATLAVKIDPNPLDVVRYARVTIGNAVLNVTQKSPVEPPTGAPVVTQQPANQTVPVIGSASFSVAVSGATPMTYQWRRGAYNLANGRTVIGANGPTLTLANVQPADAGSYSVVVTNTVGGTTSNAATLTVTAAAGAPANDAFANAALLVGATAQATGNNAGATSEPGEPQHNGNSAAVNSIWWRWTAPASGRVAVDTLGSNFNTVLAVYRGTSVNALTAMASDAFSGGGGGSALAFNATAGTIYQIAVAGAAGAVGTVQLRLAQAARPANDDFSGAYIVTGNSGAVSGTNVGATGETGEPAHVNSSGTASSVWYRWTAAASGSLVVDTIGSNFDTVLAAYSGSGVTALTRLAADDESGGSGSTSRIVFDVAAGASYSLAVGSYGSGRGNLALHWQYRTAPANATAPAIAIHPQSKTVLLGSSVTFYVVASGTGPLSYQWKKGTGALVDGGRISGANGATLTLSNVLGADAGEYSVVVTNLLDGATSYAAVLTVNPGGGAAPTVAITAPAAGAVLPMGVAAAIAATAADSDGTVANVQFFAGSLDLGTDATAPYGVSWSPPGPGDYSLSAVATDNSGNQTTSTVVRVTVVVMPMITSSPTASVKVGTSFSYSITASGNPTSFAATGLPAGLQLDSATGLISGVPTAVGVYTVTLSATSASGTGPSTVLTLTVATPGTAPSITTPPLKQQVNEGGTIALSVAAGGTAPLSYQWKKGTAALVEGGRIAGSTTANLTITGALPTDSGTYSVVVTNSVDSVTSTGVVVGVVPMGTGAAHFVMGPGYNAGGTVTISNTITYTGTPTGLMWHVLLPDGWSYATASGAVGETKPTVGATGLLDWIWTTVPASPVTFTYTLNVPVGTTGTKTLTSLETLTQNGVGLSVLAQPDPLSVFAQGPHSADTDKNFRITLVELTRVMELFNARLGTVRTGRYRVQAGSEDGFAPDPVATSNQVLAVYHSADCSPRDGQISLLELTRLIQLYNYRAGTLRTGQYHFQSGTEDGYDPGP